VDLVQPIQPSFHQQLGFTVCIRRLQRVLLFNGRTYLIAEERSYGRKKESLHPAGQHRSQNRQSIRRVVPEKRPRKLHRLARLEERRKMHHRLKLARVKRLGEFLFFGQIANDQLCSIWYGLTVPVAQIVNHAYMVSSTQ
jgi:hypothetical protein